MRFAACLMLIALVRMPAAAAQPDTTPPPAGSLTSVLDALQAPVIDEAEEQRLWAEAFGLVASGADPNEHSTLGTTLLFEALRSKLGIGKITLLLESGADPNAPVDHGQTPLMQAAGWLTQPYVDLLLEHGADPKSADDFGFTSLECALAPRSSVCAPGVVRSLIKAGADVNHRDANGWTPLMYAARWAPLESIRILLANGADPTVVSKNGWTALTVAVGASNIEAWKAWLGADPRMTDQDPSQITFYATVMCQYSTSFGEVERVRRLLRFAKIDLEAERKRREFDSLRSDWETPQGQQIKELLENPPEHEDPAAPEGEPSPQPDSAAPSSR